MDPLRITLLVIGVLVILAVYWWSTRGRRAEGDDHLSAGEAEGYEKPVPRSLSHGNAGVEEPYPDPFEELEGVGRVVVRRDEQAIEDEELGRISTREDVEEDLPDGEELIIALTIMAPPGRPFSGSDVVAAAQAVGMEFGMMDIFHFHSPGRKTPKPVFSLASAVEPGVIDPEEADAILTPGLILFMRLPGPLEGEAALDTMLDRARILSEQLDGELCDETRSVLTPQTIGHLRERISEWRLHQLQNRRRPRP